MKTSLEKCLCPKESCSWKTEMNSTLRELVRCRVVGPGEDRTSTVERSTGLGLDAICGGTLPSVYLRTELVSPLRIASIFIKTNKSYILQLEETA